MAAVGCDTGSLRRIPVLDLFAGPGGLGEGFARFRNGCGTADPPFQIVASVEMDTYAHATLVLRAFYRCWPRHAVPGAYYDYLRGRVSREHLFARFPDEKEFACREAIRGELGKDDPQILELTDQAVGSMPDGDLVLIGGPPCQAYSVIGRSRRAREPRDAFEADPRHRLYKHYLRMLVRYRPAVFVMENVRGLLSATLGAGSVFAQILSDLRRPSGDDGDLEYVIWPVGAASTGRDPGLPADYVVRCEHHGVPQTRHRVILLGVRADIKAVPRSLEVQPPVTVRDAIGDLPRLRSDISSRWGSGCWADTVERARKALMSRCPELIEVLERPCASDLVSSWRPSSVRPQDRLAAWLRSAPEPVICNHEARSHMPDDLARYLFVSSYAAVHSSSPKLRDFPNELLPAHRSAHSDEPTFDDRFRVQLWDHPASTITSHIAKDGHYFIHPDPSQCRSLTVREAARLQTFPDDYYFEGPRTEQYRQVGNAVPPLLAYQIANIVYSLLRGDGGTSN